LSSNCQSFDNSKFFKRNDTLFLARTLLPYNGQIPNDTSRKFYLNGVLKDSTALESDIWNFLVYLIIPFDKDTFMIDSRNKINPAIFTKSKYFFLNPVDKEPKSRIIDIDTLHATTYSQIKADDKSYYEFYEQAKRCPIGNHKDNLVEYLWGLPNKKGLREAKKKKVILMGCMGSGEGGQLYYCKLHKIDF